MCIRDRKEAVLKYQEIFGRGNYFLELQDHGIPMQRQVNQGIIRLSRELDIPLAATNDCHYINAEDWEAHDILLCIQTGKKVADENRMRYEGGQYYVKSEEEMRELFSYIPEEMCIRDSFQDREPLPPPEAVLSRYSRFFQSRRR